LIDIGKHHPQSLIYPLTVASKASAPGRQASAKKILDIMQVHSPNLVQQAMLVSEELIRIAILWHELWHEGLEEASRLYFGERNVRGMFEILDPLHQMCDRGPQTLKEMSFNQAYGRDLSEAQEWCRSYTFFSLNSSLKQCFIIFVLFCYYLTDIKLIHCISLLPRIMND
jgi:FKBP12-rapamycin complex-associated protein